MSFNKVGSLSQIKVEDLNSCVPMVSEEVLESFKKQAEALKKVAPRADDFLYFTAVMIHAAEASSINDDGTPKLTRNGENVKVSWDKSNDSWKWKSNDVTVLPYKNSNGDIFPEAELILAHKKWIHKPLCIDHKSSSVDHVRGFIVDTYYDRTLKRVIGLCALDKKNYPDLAHKVSSGYSHCVSMGTAVGRAICSDCGKVARAEPDFCNHMRMKSCYGEINVDLNPIELSIVVNGADPKAHIKQVLASANTLNSYVESKSKQLNKIANKNFTANISVQESDGSTADAANFSFTDTDLNAFKANIEDAMKKLEEIKSENDNNLASNMSSGTKEMDETEDSNTSVGMSVPGSARLASSDLLSELHKVTAAIEHKLSDMKSSLEILTKKQEEHMSEKINKEAYYQGTEEPTPGQAKYPADPLSQKLREKDDKQMVGQSPFTGVGDVEGLHPSPASVDISDELERKKMLARAESEERAMKRTAIVNAAKQALAYPQGTTEPAGKGKVTYPADKLNEQLRLKDDKQMVGQKPFPGVGDVEGLHPSPASADVSDELKRKEMLRRANTLKGKFVKASNTDGTTDLSKSAWHFTLGEKVVFAATVHELSGGNSELMYDNIATKEFGTSLIEKLRTYGADGLRSLVKKAQMPAHNAPAAPAMEAPAHEEAPKDDAMAEIKAPEGTDETVSSLENIKSDIEKVIGKLEGEDKMGDKESEAPAEGMPAQASFGTYAMRKLGKEIHSGLLANAKEILASLTSVAEEMTMIKDLYESGSVNSGNAEFVGSIAEDSLSDAKTSIADGFKLMTAYVKYAKSKQSMEKKAQLEEQMMAHDGEGHKSLSELLEEIESDATEADSMYEEEESLEGSDSAAADDNDVKMTPAEMKAGLDAPGTKIEVVASLDTLEGRAALRAKLAATTMKMNPILHEGHPKGSATLGLDVKPSDNGAVIEDLEDRHDAMLDVATAPVKVRKEAEAIHQLISEGKLSVDDLDSLVAEGADKDAVAYYKKYWGQVDGGSEFAGELVKEHAKAEMELELNKFRIKLARSYELAYDMVERGLCLSDRAAITNQVDEIMKFNDDSFDSLKRVVAKHAPVAMKKQAGRMPQVTGEYESAERFDAENENLFSQLSSALSKNSKRMF